jgi:hypothetical protein
MDRKAIITLKDIAWWGERDGYRIVTSAQLRVAKGRTLSPETLGKSKSGYTGVEFLFYEVEVERIVEDRVGFAYQRLVIANRDGSINLTAPNSGRFILRRGESVKLSTPVMDGGSSISVTLDDIC